MLTNMFTYFRGFDTLSIGDNDMKTIIETVPITKFNRGQAGKIFGDGKKTNNVKLVIKNNEPEVVILSPKTYNEIISVYEKYQEKALYSRVAERLLKGNSKRFSKEEVLKELGISQEDLDATELSDVEKWVHWTRFRRFKKTRFVSIEATIIWYIL